MVFCLLTIFEHLIMSYMKSTGLLFIILILAIPAYGQNTVGALNNNEGSYNAYTLFTAQTETYLINNCGQVINQWSSSFPPGNAVYLLENGNLLRAAKIDNPDINFGGRGGRIELFDWDGNLIWEYTYSTNLVSHHHDVFPMPNGNILMLAVSTMTLAEATQAGRDPATLAENKLYNEQILELEPVGTNDANIVWEWNIKDHLIQDFDNSKDNFGIINENPQLLDINFLGTSNGNPNWMHINSMQYYEKLDQIVLSSRQLNEVYIIDHSTTTAQASSSSGGTYGKGGDLLYRWGNPTAYNRGTTDDQQLFGQHYPYFIPDGLNDAGKLLLFNNGFTRTPEFSEVFILQPPTDAPGFYSTPTTAYGPSSPEYIYTDPRNQTNFFSPFLSNAQRLPNGNTLIIEGASGYFFEIDPSNNKVWEYVNPVGAFGILTQGESPAGEANTTFRAIKYGTDYQAFVGRDLTPGDPIELNPNLNNCTILSTGNQEITELKVFPNPTANGITIESLDPISKVEIYSIDGKKLKTLRETSNIDLRNFSSGLYNLKLFSYDKTAHRKIVKL